MAGISVPWSETPPPPLPTPPQQHHSRSTEDLSQNSQHCDSTEDASPTSGRRGSRSPAGSPIVHHTADAIQIAYSAAVESSGEPMTVIRGLKTLSPDHTQAGEQLVYQTLGDNNGFMGQYGVSYVGSYSPTPTSSTPGGSTSPYSYLKSASCYENVQMVHAYESDNPRAISPQSVVYSPIFQHPSQEVNYASTLPMWGALNNNNAGTYSGLGSPILENNEVSANGRGSYSSYVSSPYLLTSAENAWSTLPSMTTSSYLQDGRRSQYSDPPPEYGRISEAIQHQCAMCGTTDSTPWRRDSTGQYVCNACGICKNGITSRASAIRPQRRLVRHNSLLCIIPKDVT
nr:GATA-binding factor 6-B isoform X1 [Parasteatoda tepidariorum]XP_042901515.1 GATA-binding factor 6-B isoform X1 [Parasteatoda tepidariorum]XP_042901516.1 GATA-binding factor 6-B isoform X1 [Parasteatoda tepidariorum]XP_042901517.1 GATA-binding factor 6-B isoform X1 [Parasteatoda tepidariorum]